MHGNREPERMAIPEEYFFKGYREIAATQRTRRYGRVFGQSPFFFKPRIEPLR